MMRAHRLILTGIAVLGVLAGGVMFWSAPAFATPGYGFASSFGKEGSGAGEFTSPSDVAVNEVTSGAVGDVYVVDKGNDRVEYFNSTGTLEGEFNGSATPAKSFSSPEAIAIDNDASSPSKGDVYVTDVGHDVIDKFSATGAYLGQITKGSGGAAFGRLDGVAVDRNGVLWADQESGEIDDFSNEEPNTFLSGRESQIGLVHPNNEADYPGFAVDSEDNLYIFWHWGVYRVAKLDSAGTVENESFGGVEEMTGIAVDLANDDVYLDEAETKSIGELSATGSLLDSFGAGGSGHLTGGSGVAVNAATGTFYVADSAGDDVDIFMPGFGEAPIFGGESSSVFPGGVTLTATVNPGTLETTYAFEYATSEEAVSKGEGTRAAGANPLPAGSAALPVSIGLPTSVTPGDLTPFTTYYYRVVAENAQSKREGKPVAAAIQSFTTGGGVPLVSTSTVFTSGQSSANVTGTVNPDDAETYYYYQYGPTTEYGQSTMPEGPGVSVGAGTTPVPAPATLVPLAPGVTYHYRLVAWNEDGTGYGQDETFTTEAGQSPLVTTGPASGVSVNEATISGTINPEGKETSYRFEYGENNSYGTQTFGTVLPEQGVQTVTLNLRGIDPDTTYHYRLVVSNPGGTSYGEDMTFTTLPIAFPVIAPTPPTLIALPNITFPTGIEPTTKPGKPKKHAKKTHGKKKHKKAKKKKAAGKGKKKG